MFGKKIFIDVWDLGDELFEGKFGKMPFLNKILQSFDAFMIKNANVVFVHNKFVEERIKKEIKTNASIIEYNGIPYINSKVGRVDRLYQHTNNKIIILHRAMLYKKEGVIEYAQCVKRFFDKYGEQNILFYQTGVGELQYYLQNFIIQNNLQDKFILTGFISDIEEYWKIIKNSDTCIGMDILEHANSKTLSTKYIEYTSAEKPIIAWELPVINEYLKDYVYVVKNGDIECMVDIIYRFTIDKNLREKYSQLSRIAYQKLFAEEVQKEKILSIFNKIFI